jgi:hypothetical protein
MLPDSYGASILSLSARMALLLAFLPLAGCASQLWAKPGGTPAEFEGAKAGCNTQSYAMFPPMMQQVMVMAGYVTPVQTSCSGGGYAVNCFTTGGNYVPPLYVPVDQNQGARNSAVRSCLMTAGWQPVKDKEEAALVTNSALAGAPQQSVPVASATMSSGWDAARAACRTEANAAANFANGFDRCMKTHGW